MRPKQRVPVSKRFAANLSRIREAKGLTQAALAERVGKHRVYITQLESGNVVANPRIDTVELLANALGVSMVDLLR